MTKKGMNMKVSVEEVNKETPGMEECKSEGGNEGNNDYQAMVDQDYEFKCESWKADPSMFIPPTDVEFIDMNAMVNEMKQDLQGMKKVCEMLTGEEKEECLKGFEE